MRAGSLLCGAGALLLLVACSADGDPVSSRMRDCALRAYWQAPPGTSAEQVMLVGDFNFWDPEAQALQDRDADGLYMARVNLAPGTYLYRIRVDGREYNDPYNPLTLFDNLGRECSAFRVADCARPAFEVLRAEASSGRYALDLEFLRSQDGEALDAHSLRLELDGQVVEAELSSLPETEKLQIRLDVPSTGKHVLRVSARDEAGVEAEALQLPFWIEDEPFDWRDALIYQVVTDRFRDAGGQLHPERGISMRHGGDLNGLTQAVEEGTFDALGVRVLWVSPAYENPEEIFIGRDGHEAQAYHGYWPAAAREVEAVFGGAEALRALVAAAHARGMRVLLDVVPNHVHIDHPYWRDHEGPLWFNHPEGDCICGTTCPWALHMEDCWFDPFLADLRHENVQVVDRLVEDCLWWLETFDLDGLRIDAVPMMPRLFVRHLRARVHERFEQGGTPVYLLGECYTDRGGQSIIRNYLGPHSLSGLFDFPLMWALRDALAGRSGMQALADEQKDSQRAWEGSGAVMAPMLGNHDVGRFVSDVRGDALWSPRTDPPEQPEEDKPYDLLRLGFSFLLSQPGAPVIYYGDELGLAGATDPDNRRDMPELAGLADNRLAVLAHVRKLGQARRCSRALRRGALQTLLVHDNLLVSLRDAGDGLPAITVLNRAAVERDFQFEIPAEIKLAAEASFADLFGAEVQFDPTSRMMSLRVGARSSALILAEQACAAIGEE